MPKKLTPEQMTAVLSDAKPERPKQRAASQPDHHAAPYKSEYDDLVLHFLDNRNRPEESKFLDGPLWPPSDGAGHFAHLITCARLCGFSEKGEELPDFVSMIENTSSSEVRSLCFSAFSDYLAFHKAFPAALKSRIEVAIGAAEQMAAEGFERAFEGETHE